MLRYIELESSINNGKYKRRLKENLGGYICECCNKVLTKQEATLHHIVPRRIMAEYYNRCIRPVRTRGVMLCRDCHNGIDTKLNMEIQATQIPYDMMQGLCYTKYKLLVKRLENETN